MAGISAIEHALSDVNPCSGNIDAVVHVRDLVDRTAVDSHSHLNFRVVLERLRDFQRTTRRLFEIFKKQQGHTIAGRQADQFIFCFSSAETLSAADDAVQLLKRLDLVVDQQFRIRAHID
ncbi:MAG: hypothetical protein AUG74_03050 [Bacteroidetes bacterium 13_1_20CM_4_60_6]|nr:MAG: hypothetical protein AUG74_03050 [Bacteroidetes bacterium 13_1_20CM_4_60_6]